MPEGFLGTFDLLIKKLRYLEVMIEYDWLASKQTKDMC